MTGQGFCPVCGRLCHLTDQGRLCDHTDPRMRYGHYGPACPGEYPQLPIIPARQVDR